MNYLATRPGDGEALRFPTELFQENPVFFLEVFNDSLLVSAHPTGDRDEQELELRRHRVENLSKVPVALNPPSGLG